MYVANNYIVCLFVWGTAEKQLADAVSLVKKLEEKKAKISLIIVSFYYYYYYLFLTVQRSHRL